jgi:L-lactate dehydrogenase (cytochrome)
MSVKYDGTPATAPRRLRNILALDDFEVAARRHLPRPVFGYVSGAAETNASLHDNRAAFAEIGFLPRALIDVSKRSQKRELFGTTYAAPFGIAPVGLSALSAYRGDLVLAQAAAASGIPMIMSGTSLIRLEEIVAANPQAWFQAYVPGEERWMLALVDRVAQAGFGTLVLTVDTPVMANRENNIRNGFSTPMRPTPRLFWDGMVRPRWSLGTFLRTIVRHGMPHFENASVERGSAILSRNVVRQFGPKDRLSWDHFDLIRKRWKGRFIVKGIMTREDARIALDRGADGVILSNHGGRQLDGTASPLRVLPAVAEEIGGRIPVMIDGGFRRGTDVLKALALGASFVFLGRPFIYAAAIGGEPGVRHAFSILHEEIDRNMALLGINTLDELHPRMLIRLARSAESDASA